VLTKPDPRFLSITAHDLRGSVGVLDGAMRELTRGIAPSDPESAKLVQMMSRSSQRLLLLGDRLSALAKLMDGSELELQEGVDLSGLVKEAAQRAFAAHARRNLKLVVDAPQLTLTVHAQTFAGAVAEMTGLFCGYCQAELRVLVTSDAEVVRVRFQSDNPSENAHRSLRDRTGTTQANAGLTFAESVLTRHRGSLEVSEADGSNAALTFVLAR